MSSEKERIAVAFDATQADFLAFADYYYKHSAEGKRGRNRMFLLGAVLFGVFALSEARNPDHGLAQPWNYAAYVASAGLLIAGVIFAYLRLLRPFVIQLACRRSALRETFGPTQVSADKRGVSVETASGRGSMAWGEVRGVGETSDHLFVMIAPMRAFIIPRRAFASPEDSAQAYEQMTAWQGHAFRQRPATQ